MSTTISGRVSIGGKYNSRKAEELYNVLAKLSDCECHNFNDVKNDIMTGTTGTLDFYKTDEVDDGIEGIQYFHDYGAPTSLFEPIVSELVERKCCFDCFIFGKEYLGFLDTLLDMRVIINRHGMEHPDVLVGNIAHDLVIPTPALIKVCDAIDHDGLTDDEKLEKLKEVYPHTYTWQHLEPFLIL